MRIHLIATGGSIMHNLAIAMKKSGHQVTGSDDAIYEPAAGRLRSHGLLPAEIGWFPEKITKELDLVVLGMHAKKDNPELQKAQELGIQILSFPDYIFEKTKNKTRVVIAGSHGKTTVTAMILHVLNAAGIGADYALGSSVAGLEDSVHFSDDNELAIIEGDEYLSSALQPQPKFLSYHPQICVINGVAWDHFNVFPTYDIYLEQFRKLLDSLSPEAKVFYPAGDVELQTFMESSHTAAAVIRSETPIYEPAPGGSIITGSNFKQQVQIFGRHNISNAAVAAQVCRPLGVREQDFWHYLKDFSGAGRRMERWFAENKLDVIRDFAHSPSKVAATVKAILEQFPGRPIKSVLELHTFSSLNPGFIGQYTGALNGVHAPIVVIDDHALVAKGGTPFTQEEIRKAFDKHDIQLVTQAKALEDYILSGSGDDVWLLMSSGNFLGLDIKGLIARANGL